jgi:polyhydroxybutyrate depolymerase
VRPALAVVALAIACGRGSAAPESAAPGAVPPAPSAGCRPGILAAAGGDRHALDVDGEERSYLLDAPAGPADLPRPVVLAFHGFRDNARAFRSWTGWAEVARSNGAVVVHPEGHEGVELLGTTGRGWDLFPDQQRDTRFVRALLDELERDRCIDRRRLFATGMSNGGFFASLLGCTLADRVAAVAAVAGAMPLRDCRPSRPVPVLLIHGSADRVVEPATVRAARTWWAQADGCDGTVGGDGCVRGTGCAADVIECEGPEAHRWPADATARIWRFFESHPGR